MDIHYNARTCPRSRELIIQRVKEQGQSVREVASLRGAQLVKADLKGVDLRGADLREVDLSDIKNWSEIDKIEGANLAESENAPEGFLEWCKKNGALF